MRDRSDPISSLVELGFTDLEASVYVYLVEHSPATGYRVSHDIGKPVANTYKAIESLHHRGAVIVDESGDNRQVHAVPPDELLQQLARTFRSRYEDAERALTRLSPTEHDLGVYLLTQPEQVLARARSMLEQANDVVLCDLFPGSVAELGEHLTATARRGVLVAIRSYEPTELEDVSIITSARGSVVRKRWPGEWLNMVVDGTQLLLSFMREDTSSVHQAVWTGSPFLSWVYHVALSWEITGTRIEEAFESGEGGLEKIRELVADFERIRTPGSHGYRQVTSLVQGGGAGPISNLLADTD